MREQQPSNLDAFHRELYRQLAEVALSLSRTAVEAAEFQPRGGRHSKAVDQLSRHAQTEASLILYQIPPAVRSEVASETIDNLMRLLLAKRMAKPDGAGPTAEELNLPLEGPAKQDLPVKKSAGLRIGAVEKSVPIDIRLKTVGIRAAREIQKLIPPERLDSYGELKFTFRDEELLANLFKLEMVSQEDLDAKEAGFAGVAVALAISKTEEGAKFISQAPVRRAKKNAAVVADAANAELKDLVKSRAWPKTS